MVRRLWPWLRLLLACGILLALLVRLGAGAFVDGLRAVDLGSLVAALGIGLVTTLCGAARWCVVARGLGLPLSLGTAVPDYYRALLLNAVLPAGVLGDVHRAVSHGQRAGDLGRGIRAVVFERFAGQVVLIAIALVVILAQPPLDLTLDPAAAITVLAIVIGLAGFAGLWRKRAATVWADARAGLLSRRAFPSVALLSTVAVAGHLALLFVAARVSGTDAPAGRLLPLFVVALLVMAIPVNVGGWGPREAFLAAAFGAAGLGAAHGLTTAVVYGVLALVASLPGALFLFRKNGEVVRERGHQPGEQVLALAR
ncbi:flippase-like domain-containing protein [Actinokineospora sp. HBU206404]|uniref:Flippase-like domain-containing protein n=2 Tax=Actinokineospora xionganensis TaxID=2684470 RepID=A0ABR7LEZ8_9PSEU|nr:flippase-like domain-containing protein [Actinokineospora xionganensis]